MSLIEFGRVKNIVGRISFAVITKTINMKNIFYTFLILFIGISSSSQEIINADLKTKETPIIYVLGGMASGITKEDVQFSEKYNIQYYNFGCLAPENMEKYEKLNILIFEQLNKKFGINWQKEIKPGTMGFEKWKKN